MKKNVTIAASASVLGAATDIAVRAIKKLARKDPDLKGALRDSYLLHEADVEQAVLASAITEINNRYTTKEVS